jgi:hypothetical protein
MQPPFTVDEFLRVFTAYNEAFWPAPLIFNALAIIVVVLAASRHLHAGRWIAGVLAALWAWMGVVYHWIHFAAINPAAYVFGALFVLEAILLFRGSVADLNPSFRPRRDLFGFAGAALVFYALVIYPILGYLSGHTYPEAPTFGLPCPTTIFTLGVLLWSDSRLPVWLVAIPLVWAVIGSFAAITLTITEDYGLLAAGVVAAALILTKNRQLRRPAACP